MPGHGGKATSHCAHGSSRASAGGEAARVRSEDSDKMFHDTGDSYGGNAESAKSESENSHALEGPSGEHHDEEGHRHGSGERPMFATITVAVCHCGAGCVLGDIVGEWLVYGTGIAINGQMLWAEYLIGTWLSSMLSYHLINSSRRFRFCDRIWHILSVLFDRTHDW